MKKENVKKAAGVLVTATAISAVMTSCISDSDFPLKRYPIIAAAQGTDSLNATPSESVKKTNLKWEIDDEGTLCITGKGAIPDYTDNTGSNPAPWGAKNTDKGYSKIYIGSEITKIGSNAFTSDDNSGAVTEIVIASKSISISKDAFKNLNLQTLNIPITTKVEKDSFNGCSVRELLFEGNSNIENFSESGLKIGKVYGHYNTSEALKKQLATMGVINIESACTPTSISDEQGNNPKMTMYKCDICGHEFPDRTMAYSHAFKFDGKVVETMKFSDSYTVQSEKEQNLKSALLEKYAKAYVPVSAKLVNESTGDETEIKKVENILDRDEDALYVKSRTDSLSTDVTFKAIPVTVKLDGGEHHKDAIESVTRNSDTLQLPKTLTSDSKKYVFAGWRLYDENGKAIVLENYDDLYSNGTTFPVWDALHMYYGNSQTKAINAVKQMANKENATIELRAVAQWVKKDGKFNVIYNPNGGVGDKFVEQHALEEDDATPLSFAENIDIDRDGYQFVGWNTKADGSGIQFDTVTPVSGTSFGGKALEDKESVELYAQWVKYREITVSYEFDDNNNSDGTRPEELSYEVITSLGDLGEIKDEITANTSEKKNDIIKVIPVYADYQYDSNDEPVSMKWLESTTKIVAGKNTKDVPGYTVTLEKVSDTNYKFVYTHKPEKTSKKITFKWDDNKNNDGKRPTKLDLVILREVINCNLCSL